MTDSLTESADVPIAGIWSAGVALFRSLICRIGFAAIACLVIEGVVTAGRALLATGKAVYLLYEQREQIDGYYKDEGVDGGGDYRGLT